MRSEAAWIRKLMRAAGDGDLTTVRRLIEINGMPVDLPDPRNQDTPLHHAAGRGHAEVVAYLLSAGADPNAANMFGATPIKGPCYGGHVAVVELLLEAGADVRPHARALLSASRYCEDHEAGLALTRMFLAAGADPDAVSTDPETGAADPHSMTPLLEALVDGRYPLAVALLDAGADIHARGHAGRTALAHALRGTPALVERLLAAGAELEVDERGTRAVHLAVQYDNIPMVDTLVRAGADLHALDSDGRSAHTMARLLGLEAMVAWLEAQGVAAQPAFDDAVAEERARHEELLQRRATAQARMDRGTRGRITSGTFKGFEGAALSEQDGQLTVMVVIFGRHTEVSVPADAFEETS